MDEEEKKKLSKEMFNCVAYLDDGLDIERFFELLDMGASINYKHPELGATPIHAVGQYYPEFLEETLKRSHEEYDFLARDNDGRLASAWAFDGYPENKLYEILREKEIEAGKQKGIFPMPLRDVPLEEAEKPQNHPEPPEM